ncbi:sensor histidine kinase [Pseudoteredinibacter isoporae]|uniref:histidine kinase n=1 Tax=Pseudoteredinibacter isoporae TaxID=570281 RepID=A0A7X0JPT6_9GAMM|nr:HAMP domain-containing sensor histidine kinase [Pseudoteredinibacter isoporae]MBB6520077.1 signal transduction histidine kinase [Pseudoteredinibacter isoporae]NHO85649.1 HAMP domain-containing histidine kinase [Pseudoteredinibacter isoporae]NIB25899.1 HAMP domain-containing histidine kinase [Pseudoteredinibacter isoporae]
MLYPINSYFWRVLANLLPFSFFVVLLYSLLIEYSIYGTEDHIAHSYLKHELNIALQNDASELPSTSYFKSYREGENEIPVEYQSFENGIHELPDRSTHVAVSNETSDGKRIYIVLDEDELGSLQKLDGPLHSTLFAIGCVVLFASFFIATFLARSLAKPIMDLAEDASVNWQPGYKLHGQDRGDELGVLSRALAHLLQQQAQQLDREKSFTRHASHEMRTPAAIIRNSVSVLQLKSLDEDKIDRNLRRISNAGSDIESIVDTFLALGRAHDRPASMEHWKSCNLKQILQRCIERQSALIEQKAMDVDLQLDNSANILAHKAMITVALQNLLRNAVNHGSGQIRIEGNIEYIQVSNPIAEQNSQDGYGYGQEIISRICEYHDWQATFSEVEQQYIARIDFSAFASHA